MDDLYIELRTLHRGSMSHDIAQHLFTRQFLGRAIVLSDRPMALASAVGKQWQQLCRDVQRARSSTLQTSRVREMDREITHMQQLKIVGQLSAKPLVAADVLIIDPATTPIPNGCQTLYIACKLPDKTLRKVLHAMPSHAVVVRY
ncbi:MAG TPA: hypothetical protein VJ843_04785 [Candidatus Saccharimonadales bacterium]|nr:hypothetical protein [Candidatus Saccharimonadales bacterium]